MTRAEIIELAKLTHATSAADKRRAKFLMDKAIRQTNMDMRRRMDGNPILRLRVRFIMWLGKIKRSV